MKVLDCVTCKSLQIKTNNKKKKNNNKKTKTKGKKINHKNEKKINIRWRPLILHCVDPQHEGLHILLTVSDDWPPALIHRKHPSIDNSFCITKIILISPPRYLLNTRIISRFIYLLTSITLECSNRMRGLIKSIIIQNLLWSFEKKIDCFLKFLFRRETTLVRIDYCYFLYIMIFFFSMSLIFHSKISYRGCDDGSEA